MIRRPPRSTLFPTRRSSDLYRFVGKVEEAAGRILLAVLPFENLSGSRKHDSFSDGLTEEMITQLGRLDPRRLRSEEHTSELQSQSNIVCRLLLEKKNND